MGLRAIGLIPFLLLGPFPPAPANAEVPRTCFGEEVTIAGSPDRDVLIGTERRDVIWGDAGPDEIRGAAGNDLLCGGPGNDQIFGGMGNDSVHAQRGGGLVSGGPGNDYVWGWHLSGEGGDDHLVCTGSNEYVNVYAGVGNDVVHCGRVNGGFLSGGRGRDRLLGSDSSDVMSGGPGRDVLRGRGSNDSLTGGSGDDVLRGGDGTDTVNYGGSPLAVRVDLSAGLAQGWGSDRLQNLESAWGSEYDDVLIGDATRNQLIGNNGDDVLRGKGGNDRLSGRYDSAYLTPDQGGDDRLFGGDGVDIVGFSARVHASLRRGWSTGDGVDTFFGFEGLRGSRGRDRLMGSAGAERLFGNHGNDELFGRGGNDIINGGKDSDSVDGGDGIDECREAESETDCE